MKRKNIIKLINEEISEFDFLGINERLQDEDYMKLLLNEDFQKQFICDSLLSINDYRKIERNKKIKTNVVDSTINWDWEDTSYLSLQYSVDIEYVYDIAEKPVKFSIGFDSEKISTTRAGYDKPARLGGTPDTDTEGESKRYFNDINWNDINVTMWTPDGDEIDFLAFKHAPHNIQELFIREYTEDFIENKTMPIADGNKNVSKSPYC